MDSKTVDMTSNEIIQKLQAAIIEDNVWTMLQKKNLLKKTDFKGFVNTHKKIFQITLRATKGNFFYKALKGKIKENNNKTSRIEYSIGFPKETIILYALFILLCVATILYMPATNVVKLVLSSMLLIAVLLNYIMVKRMLKKYDYDSRLVCFLNSLF